MTANPEPNLPDDALLREVELIAERAGRVILDIYNRGEGGAWVSAKADKSPVTEADEAAEAVILPALQKLLPDVPVVSEEAAAHGIPDLSGGKFWLVDPMDGTKEFLARNGEFTVNIGLVEGGKPILGVVHAPAIARTYSGIPGRGARMSDGDGPAKPIAARPVPREGLVLVRSRSHNNSPAMQGFLDSHAIASERKAGSSLKFCLVASGEADVYPRFGRTMEWDTAAGQAVLLAAGGSVVTQDGQPLRYGKLPVLDNSAFFAWGKR